VSLVSVAVSQSVLMVGFGLLHWTASAANVVACAVATVPSYYLNRCWAWGRRGRSHLWKEVVPFWVIAFAGLALSTWAADLGSVLARDAAASHAVTTAIVMASSLLAFGVLWVGKFALFNALLFSERPQPRHLRPPSRRRELVTATRSLRALVVAAMAVGLLFAGSASMRAAEPADPPESTGPPTSEPATTAPPTSEAPTTAPPTTAPETTQPPASDPSTTAPAPTAAPATTVLGGGAATTSPVGAGGTSPAVTADGGAPSGRHRPAGADLTAPPSALA
jgi:putative flippase GtrA